MSDPMNAKALFIFALLVLAVHAQDMETFMSAPYGPNMSETAEDFTDALKDNPDVAFMASCTAPESTENLAADLFRGSAIALFIMAMGIALMYMAGNFFQSQNVLVLAKQEVNEFVLTAGVAILFVFIVTAPTFFGVDLFQEATNYSYKMLYKVSSVSAVMTSANIALNSIYTLFIPFGQIRKSLTIQLGPALRPLIDGVSFSLQFLITTYGEWTVFMFMFCFIQRWFLPFFFPLGLLMRAVPQLRGGGNALIGFSIALSTIYPLMFYLDSAIFDSQFPPSSHLSAEYFWNAVQTLISSMGIAGFASIFLGLSMIFVSPILVSGLMLLSYMFVDVATETIRLIVIFSLVLPVVNIFLTLSFAREISRLLGTEISISAFAKLI